MQHAARTCLPEYGGTPAQPATWHFVSLQQWREWHFTCKTEPSTHTASFSTENLMLTKHLRCLLFLPVTHSRVYNPLIPIEKVLHGEVSSLFRKQSFIDVILYQALPQHTAFPSVTHVSSVNTFSQGVTKTACPCSQLCTFKFRQIWDCDWRVHRVRQSAPSAFTEQELK